MDELLERLSSRDIADWRAFFLVRDEAFADATSATEETPEEILMKRVKERLAERVARRRGR